MPFSCGAARRHDSHRDAAIVAMEQLTRGIVRGA
jgi:hypothetical protein